MAVILILMGEREKKIKFIVVSTRIRSGGAVALHYMYQELRDLGYDASIFYANIHDGRSGVWFWIKLLLSEIKNDLIWLYLKCRGTCEYNNRFCWGYHEHDFNKVKRWMWPKVPEDAIVVYPEVFDGNPLHSRKTVRWLLSKTSHETNLMRFDPNDFVVAYRSVFNDATLNSENNVCNILYYDTKFYKQVNFGKREGKCYLIYKGRNRNDLPEKFDGAIVDKLSEQEKVTIFNECKYFISYDTQSAFATLAALCGCISIVIPEEGKCREDYLGTDTKAYGVAYGTEIEEIEYAVNTQHMLKEYVQQLNNYSKENVSLFAQKCEEYFDMVL